MRTTYLDGQVDSLQIPGVRIGEGCGEEHSFSSPLECFFMFSCGYFIQYCPSILLNIGGSSHVGNTGPSRAFEGSSRGVSRKKKSASKRISIAEALSRWDFIRNTQV